VTRRKHPPRAPQPTIAPSRLPARDRWILVALVIVPLAVYGRVTGYDFVTYVAHANLGVALQEQGDLEGAAAHLEASFAINPDADAAFNLANVRLAQQRLPEAVALYEDLSFALVSAGRAAEAGRLLEDAVARFPGATRLVGALAWLRATSKDAGARDGAKAVRLAERACTAERTPDCLDTLAAAYAEAGRFADALDAVRAALEDAETSEEFRDELRERQALYESGKPYRAP